MNRQLHTTLPILESQLQPPISDYSVVCEKRQWGKPKVRKFLLEQIATLDPLLPGQRVWMSGRRDSGVIVAQLLSPRSSLYCINSNGRDAKE